MDIREARRRLVRHGMVLFLLGLMIGLGVPAFTSSRLGLSAHLGAVMTGTFLLALGGVWDEARLSSRHAAAAVWLTLYGAWASSVALVLAAAFGTSGMTPIAGAGQAAAAGWQEALVDFGLVSGSPALIAGCGVIVSGLRGGAGNQPGARRA